MGLADAFAVLEAGLAIGCGLVALLVVVLLVRDRVPGRVTLAVLGLLEAGVLALLVVGVGMVVDDHAGYSVVTFVGYLIACLVVLPIAWAWSASERSRGGTAVLLVGVAVLPVLFLRLHDIWSANG